MEDKHIKIILLYRKNISNNIIELEKILNVKCRKLIWGNQYIDIISNKELSYDEYEERYYNYIGKKKPKIIKYSLF